MMFGHTWGVLIAAVIVGTLASARITRLVVADHWPPMEWVRGKWDTWANDEKHPRRQGWWLLLNCPWCFSPWATLFVGGVAWLTDLSPWWWAGAVWLGFAYVAGGIAFHDEGKE